MAAVQLSAELLPGVFHSVKRYYIKKIVNRKQHIRKALSAGVLKEKIPAD